MKILEIIGNLGQGGAERLVTDLCNRLCIEHDVTLLVYKSLDNPVNSYYLPFLDKRVKIEFIPDSHKLYFQLFNYIRKNKPDIVHTHLGRSLRFPIFSYFLNRKPKYIHTVHNDAKSEAGRTIDRTIHKLVFKLRLSNPVTISDESHKSFVEFYKRDARQIDNGSAEYIRNEEKISTAANEMQGLKHKKEATSILNVARLSKQKNQKALIDAINELNEEGNKIELFIIGAESEFKFCEINQRNSPYVHFLGTRYNPRDYMAACDAFCLSSKHEGMPITLIECFSTGAIPVCTAVGGIKSSVKDGVNGILEEGTDVADIKKLIKRFLSLTKEEKKKLSKSSLETFSRYNMELCSERYIDYMNELLSK